MTIAIVLGTRPEIIKCSPIIRELERRRISYFIIHSNQHYSENMDKIFFEELRLPAPKYNLGIGSAAHGNMTGRMLIAMEEIFLKEKPSVVLAQGDTNTVLAGILAATKQDIPTGHVEAGLRSYDRRMPEEKNRIICDSIADYLFCPTKLQEQILLKEGIPQEKIFVTGNTIVDAVQENITLLRSTIMERLGLQEKKYVLFTAHRALNVDTKEALEQLIGMIDTTKEATNLRIIYPIHPRTKAMLEKHQLKVKNATLIEPLGYADFLTLQKNAHLIITDSGGVQEEACILHVPCITIRENTERPETVEVGANKIVALDKKLLREAIDYYQSRKNEWENPFGDGKTATRIVDILCKQ